LKGNFEKWRKQHRKSGNFFRAKAESERIAPPIYGILQQFCTVSFSQIADYERIGDLRKRQGETCCFETPHRPLPVMEIALLLLAEYVTTFYFLLSLNRSVFSCGNCRFRL